MDRKKLIYIGSLLILTVIVSVTYFSYAFFTNKSEQRGKINVVAGTLDYELVSNDLTNNSITIPADTTKTIEIEIKSLNTIESKYELYYETTDSVDVGYSIDTIDEPTGTISANSSKKVTVIIKNKTNSTATITFGTQGGFSNKELVLAQGNSLEQISVCSVPTGYTWNYGYTGSSQEFDVPCDGYYKVELWGAQGGIAQRYNVGLGGYTSGNIELAKESKYYIYVGGAGAQLYNTSATGAGGGFNGGGDGVNAHDTGNRASGGGGATDMRLTDGAWDNATGLNSRIMVAAGAGGTSNYANGGGAGGLIGIRASADNGYPQYNGGGGTQISGVIATDGGYGAVSSTFGSGSRGSSIGGGGGGGYYGGAGGVRSSPQDGSGGGGSSYISGHTGCVAIAEGSTSNPRAIKISGCTTGTTNQECSKHYSGLLFTNTKMIDGAGHTWTNVDNGIVSNSLMPNPDGGYYASGVGRSGNGYARITYLGNITYNTLTAKPSATVENASYNYNLDMLNVSLTTTDTSKLGSRVIFSNKITSGGILHVKGTVTINSNSGTLKSRIGISFGSSERLTDLGQAILKDDIDRGTTVSFDESFEIPSDSYMTLAIGRTNSSYSGSLTGTLTITEFYITDN